LSGLRRRSLSFLILIASALLIAPPSSRAQTASSTNPQNCGATVEDNLAAAQKAFATNDAALRPAFACLLKATIALNDRQNKLELGRPNSSNLEVKKIPHVGTITTLSGAPLTPDQ
jgi:hypothetical protein